MFAAPSSWRTYQPPRVSFATSSSPNVYVWSGKCPQKMIDHAHTLPQIFPVKLPPSSSPTVVVWSGKCPQKMIEYAHTLRTMFAVKLAATVALKDRLADSS